MSHHIPNAQLDIKHTPPENADWDEINLFAHSFDGYTASGSFERCAEIAHARRNTTLTELRTCLFFEARAWRHAGQAPEESDMPYLRELVRQIRYKLSIGDLA